MTIYKYKEYDAKTVNDMLLGANALLLTEELTEKMALHPGMIVLDLGCGKGLSSWFLAKEFGVTVYAVDPEINAGENHERMKDLNVDGLVYSIQSDASELPFNEHFFDAVIGINSWHLFGPGKGYLRDFILPIMKPASIVGAAIPGFKKEAVDAMDERTRLLLDVDVIPTMFTTDRWNEIWSATPGFVVTDCYEMNCTEQAWQDWLRTSNPFSSEDETVSGAVDPKMTFIAITGVRDQP